MCKDLTHTERLQLQYLMCYVVYYQEQTYVTGKLSIVRVYYTFRASTHFVTQSIRLLKNHATHFIFNYSCNLPGTYITDVLQEWYDIKPYNGIILT